MHDEPFVAPLVVEYYEWLSGHGGRSPDEILTSIPSPELRAQFLECLDDVNMLWGITAPVRDAAKAARADVLAQN